jgi:hypothetical protein
VTRNGPKKVIERNPRPSKQGNRKFWSETGRAMSLFIIEKHEASLHQDLMRDADFKRVINDCGWLDIRKDDTQQAEKGMKSDAFFAQFSLYRIHLAPVSAKPAV